VLNASSLLSVLVFIVPPERLWKPTSIPVASSDTLLANQVEKKT
jgi:hypothetical protein